MDHERKPLREHNTYGKEKRSDKAETEKSLGPARILRSGRRLPLPHQAKASNRARQHCKESLAASDMRSQENDEIQPLESQTSMTDNLRTLPPVTLGTTAASRLGLQDELSEITPALGLVENAGAIRLCADLSEIQPPPPGLLTAVRQAQQDVHNERLMSDLRLEIMCVQEDVRRESESEASSAHSHVEYFSQASSGRSGRSNRYQDTPRGRVKHSGPFNESHSGSQTDREDLLAGNSLPGSRTARNQASRSASGEGLIPLKEAVLKSSSTESDTDADEGRAAEYILPTGPPGQRSDTRSAKSNSQVGSSRESDSDIVDRLAALRTSNCFEESSLGGTQTGEAAAPLNPSVGYIPRAAPAPSFMDRKLQHLKAAEWSGVPEPKVHQSGLEKAKAAAQSARRDTLGSAEKAITKRLVQRAISTAVKSEGKSLQECMVRHKSRLERDKEAALASNIFNQTSKKAASATPADGLVLVKHKHRLEAEKERALAGRQTEAMPGYMRPTAASRHAAVHGGSSLGESLVVHKSRLERERDAAMEAAKPRPKARGFTDTAKKTSSWGDLGSMKPHQSGLEKAKEAAVPFERQPAKSSIPKGHSDGVLDNLKVHKSKLELDKEAWLQEALRYNNAQRQAQQASSVPK